MLRKFLRSKWVYFLSSRPTHHDSPNSMTVFNYGEVLVFPNIKCVTVRDGKRGMSNELQSYSASLIHWKWRQRWAIFWDQWAYLEFRKYHKRSFFWQKKHYWPCVRVCFCSFSYTEVRMGMLGETSRKLNAIWSGSLQSLWGKTKRGGCMINKQGWNVKINTQFKRSALKWFNHIEEMNDDVHKTKFNRLRGKRRLRNKDRMELKSSSKNEKGKV